MSFMKYCHCEAFKLSDIFHFYSVSYYLSAVVSGIIFYDVLHKVTQQSARVKWFQEWKLCFMFI